MAATNARVARFASDLAEDPAGALNSLRADLQTAGGPFVERVSAAEVDVTFVYVADVTSVQLRTSLLRLAQPKIAAPMERIAGSDVWHLTVRAPSTVAVAYSFLCDPPAVGETLAEMMEVYSDPQAAERFQVAIETASRVDPFNPGRMPREVDFATGRAVDSVLLLPDSTYRPDTADAPAPPLDEHELDGRRISVYQPRSAGPADSLPLVVLLDGDVLLRGELHRRLDVAVEAGLLPAVRVVFWHNLTLTSRMAEMACNPALADALADRLLPLLREKYGVPEDRKHRVIGGFSMGGLATAHIALARPDAFGAAMPLSAVLWFTPDPGAEPGEWLTRQYRQAPVTDTAFYVSAGQLEDVAVDAPGVAPGTTLVSAARTFYDTLQAKGYDVRGFAEIPSGHELINVYQSLQGGLSALLPRPSRCAPGGSDPPPLRAAPRKATV
ncbi:alpha/beta hydrolase [Dactylosporangium sp. CA-092794]|uniref:alpha/beta hydrolase n=1 Tax=Dactylosporangium sp. CA-092794 TaxID=3239929 RepID=UPI003D9245ED